MRNTPLAKERAISPSKARVPFGQHQDTELWNNQQARSQSLFLLKFDTVVLSKQISTFLVFTVRIECLCGTYPHRLYL